MSAFLKTCAIFAAGTLTLGCGPDDGTQKEEPPPARCRAPGSMDLPTGRLFTEVTSEVGLAGITGIRLTAADLDGDGWPDLVVHGLQMTRDSPPDYLHRVLMNRGGKFVDATAESGFLDSRDGPKTGRLSHLAVFGDVDNDGDLDAFSGTHATAEDMPPASSDRSEILINDGKGRFRFAPRSDPSVRRVPTAGASFIDYDRDGRLDLFTTTQFFTGGAEGQGNFLFVGNGDGSFADISAESGVLRRSFGGDIAKYVAGQFRRIGQGATACDVDNDGDPDLMVSAYARSWNELWRNDEGKFTDIAPGTPFAADDNITYRPDDEFYHCWCKMNAGKCPPEESNPKISCDPGRWSWIPGWDDQPVRQGGNYFTTACADLDNDGDMDVVHASIRHWHIGQSSDPSGIVRNDLSAGKLAWTRLPNDRSGLERPMTIPNWNEGDLQVAAFDFDNDGRKDIYLGSSDYPETYGSLFWQKPDGTFTDVAERGGVRQYHAAGIAALDYDRDGDLDLIVASHTARCERDPKCPATQEIRVYRNDVGAGRNFVQLRLRGAGPGMGGANLAAIGARVAVTAGGVTQVQEVSGGYGHFGMQNDTVLTFGLGATCQIDQVEVRWPDAAGSTDRYPAVVANYLAELRQGMPGVSYPSQK